MKQNKGSVILIIPITLVVGILFVLIFSYRGIFLSKLLEKEDSTLEVSQTNEEFNEAGENGGQYWTGIVCTSGLSEKEKDTFGLNSDYQIQKTLLSKGIWPEKIGGFFLESDSKLGSYFGKCVKISGKINERWGNVGGKNLNYNGTYAYARSALEISKVKILNAGECVGNFDYGTKDPKNIESEKAKGVLRFANSRPAPDIPYDFKLELVEPLTDSLSPSGNYPASYQLDISPATDEVLISVLENIGKRVELEGYLEWGYAETRFLRVLEMQAI